MSDELILAVADVLRGSESLEVSEAGFQVRPATFYDLLRAIEPKASRIALPYSSCLSARLGAAAAHIACYR